ncbi:MAG: SDR family NAD(P)-dependent oxidoreductase, partial [Candidatus Latescibacteria bacterium]|nr:SDR family NAD(P)-dependent oxidoreductase [Candidatus Latescibacterota bacterium]
MDNRRALVTGGASGFGLETARALLAQGAQVAVADIDADALHAAALDGALPLEIDVTSSASVDRGVAAAVEAFGGLDTLINSAGVI